jgi:hypothetical protein
LESIRGHVITVAKVESGDTVAAWRAKSSVSLSPPRAEMMKRPAIGANRDGEAEEEEDG